MLYFGRPACLDHDPAPVMPGHPERPERLLAIERVLAERDTVEASWEAALRAAGGACAMVRALLAGEDRVGFCGTRPAGHHAEHERAMGFCLFDNLAVAAELAIRELGVERVLVVDWDVHHGNGTAEIFRRRGEVLVADVHQQGIFLGSGPRGDAGSGPGEGYTINLPVPGGSEGALWLSLLEDVVIPAGRDFAPQLVLEGGYDVEALAECVVATLSALGGRG